MRRLLLIAPYFPPIGSVGAKRPLMLARHLPAVGWETVVLAADPAGERADPSLLELVPEGLVVERAFRAPFGSSRRSRPTRQEAITPGGVRRSSLMGWDLEHLTPFDRYLWGAPSAIAAGLRLVDRHAVAAVAVCAGPWSGLLVGLSVAQRRRLPLIVDFRDPWSLQEAKMRRTPPPTRALIRAFESRVFRRAARIVLNTESAREAYVARYAGRIGAERFTCIRNASDPGLFHPATPAPAGRWTVLHFGHFRQLVPAEPLLEGFARFVAAEKLGPETARLLFQGSLPAHAREEAAALGLDPYLEVQPSLPYRDSLALLGAADVLALVATGDMALTVPAKLYDYLAARRPVLAVTDQPEPARLVREGGWGEVASPERPEEIAAALSRLRERTRRPDRGALDSSRLAPFGAEAQAKAYGEVLDGAVEGRG
jgi:glycosyltransferase involved in cell wall biosynthesis